MKTARKRPVRLNPRPKTAPVETLGDPLDMRTAAFAWAVKAYQDAREEEARAYARLDEINPPGDPSGHDTTDWEPWTNLCTWRAHEAKEIVLIAILLANGRIDCPGDYRLMKKREWPPCSFEHQGSIYVAYQPPECRPELLIIDPEQQTADWMVGS